MLPSRDLLRRLEDIEMLALDVDGVLTDGSIWHSPLGQVYRFHVHDGLGLQRLKAAGVTVVWITARRADAVTMRAAEIGVEDVRQGITDKLAELKQAAERYGVSQRCIAYMGDDLPDVPAMEWAGVSFAPANAIPAVRACADHVCTRRGGHAAVREVCDLILTVKPMHDHRD